MTERSPSWIARGAAAFLFGRIIQARKQCDMVLTKIKHSKLFPSVCAPYLSYSFLKEVLSTVMFRSDSEFKSFNTIKTIMRALAWSSAISLTLQLQFSDWAKHPLAQNQVEMLIHVKGVSRHGQGQGCREIF